MLRTAFWEAQAGCVALQPGYRSRLWIKPAVRDLDHDLLTLEATGDYAVAKAMLDRVGKLTPEPQRAIDKLRDIPTDIDPVSVTAGRISR